MDAKRIEAYVDAAAAALAAELAELVMAAPLGPFDDPAPVFVSIAADDLRDDGPVRG
jgi:hypothetical protein